MVFLILFFIGLALGIQSDIEEERGKHDKRHQKYQRTARKYGGF